MSATKKFTARNVPALIALARECGLESAFRNSSKCYTFAPAADAVEQNYPALNEEDEVKLERFVAAADAMFGTREFFSAHNAWRFVCVDWERECRTESQLNNCD